MKKTSVIKSISAAAALGALFVTTAKADTLAGWTFETSAPARAAAGAGVWYTNIASEVGLGTASAFHAGNTVYSTPAGNGSAHSFSSTIWAVGDFYQFSLSTVGFQGINVSYDQTGSSTGPRDFNFEYSLDGTTFTTVNGTFYQLASPAVGWSAGTPVTTTSFSYDLSAITSLNNATTVYFRVADADTIAISGGTVATGGTDRVDNFVVSVPEPSTFALATIGGLGCLFAMRRNKR
ncbi:MAG TPA: PEP-CTERM sorting domain-containing protein [Verrucomicrobiae bacterium]|nr:PEP-CTERM sorting domain-containing protein [Verrucomicrobiae bacterium]